MFYTNLLYQSAAACTDSVVKSIWLDTSPSAQSFPKAMLHAWKLYTRGALQIQDRSRQLRLWLLAPSCSVQLSTEDNCRPAITICKRKHVFAYFLFHVCLWIILNGARNIPIFSRYCRQHYRKIKLQFDVLNLRKRKRICGAPPQNQSQVVFWLFKNDSTVWSVSYTHLTLPTNREV